MAGELRGDQQELQGHPAGVHLLQRPSMQCWGTRPRAMRLERRAHPPIEQLLLDVCLPLHDLQLLLQPCSLLCHAFKVCHPALLLIQPAIALVMQTSTLVAGPCSTSPIDPNKEHLIINSSALARCKRLWLPESRSTEQRQ